MKDKGYQNFLSQPNDSREELQRFLVSKNSETCYLYTQHEVFYEDNIMKQTRSGPNFEGSFVTLTTCKHHMRRTARDWEGTLIAGLGPKECAQNTLLYCGRVWKVFESNYDLGIFLKNNHKYTYEKKRASNNPRGDIYTPRKTLVGDARFDHRNFVEPERHTRSTEFYKKSPGSVSERPDGLIPKWWRDIEYQDSRGVRPVSLILIPVYLFKHPTVWTSYKPGRASLRLTANDFATSLLSRPLGS